MMLKFLDSLRQTIKNFRRPINMLDIVQFLEKFVKSSFVIRIIQIK